MEREVKYMSPLIYIIILVILGIVVSCVTYDEDNFIVVVGIGFIILVILTVIAFFNREVINEYEEEQYKIQGLENNMETTSSIRGGFILGFGYVNGKSEQKMNYYYFKVNDLGKKLEKTDTDVYIRETDKIKPCLIYKYQETSNTGFFKWLFGEDIMRGKTDTILVVPTNTVKIEYNVDI